MEDAEIGARFPRLVKRERRFDGPSVRRKLLASSGSGGRVIRYAYRPFDLRWLYWQPETKLLDEKRGEYVPHLHPSNLWLSSGQRNRKDAFYQPQVLSCLADHHIVESNVGMFPLWTLASVGGDLFGAESPDDPRYVGTDRRLNLTDDAVAFLESVGSVEANAPHLFHHAVAILHALAYRDENEVALRQDWPRVPLPESGEALLASAARGRELAALLNPEVAVPGVTTGTIRGELRVVGSIRGRDGGQLDAGAGDLDVTARWGYSGAGGATMPGRGHTEERAYSEDERDLIAAGVASLGMAEEEVRCQLGHTTFDVYLNDRAYWQCVPSRVWNYTLGGYQVIKKWLSYREKDLLGRSLRPEEAREVMNMTRRIAAILLLENRLDASYRRSRDSVAG